MKNILIYIFFIVIIGLSLLDIITPQKTYSEFENRYLSRKVKFTLKSYINGTFSKKYEDYLSDQFIGRDDWINLKSRAEYALGKTENNNILYGKNSFLFEKVTTIDENRKNLNIEAVNIFAQNSNVPVSVMIAPNSYVVYKEYLPPYVPIIDGSKEIQGIYDRIENTNNINLIETMEEKKKETGFENILYYRTDHHWTTEGAYTAYTDYISSIGKVPIDLADYKKNYVHDFLGTYYSKSKTLQYKADTINYYDFNNVDIEISGEKFEGLYDFSKAESNDKYSIFLYGNNPLSVIRNNGIDSSEKLLVIKDSYANSLVPFLSQNFKEVHVVDLRSYHKSMKNYIDENQFDQVLILYNLTTFLRDRDVLKLKN